jgi:hypothetical protein
MYEVVADSVVASVWLTPSPAAAALEIASDAEPT